MINAPQRRLGAVYEVDGVELEAVIVAHEGKENLARLMASAAADHAGLRPGLPVRRLPGCIRFECTTT
jgi:hypothetical protein